MFPATVKWTPQQGAQSLAFHSPADELFYGGEPGGGKTDLILGLATTAHRRSLILRREAKQLSFIRSRLIELMGRSVGEKIELKGRELELAGCKDEANKVRFKGRPHDLKAFDEITEFTQSQYEFIKAWNRTAIVRQRCRTVATFNPPTSPAGMWVLNYLAPWLDPKHPRPAVSGELRYYLAGEPVDGPEAVEVDGRLVSPMARTFIYSSLKDNPIYELTGYGRVLDNLPKELRGLTSTNLSAAMLDHPYQVIPIAWVQAAQSRWSALGNQAVQDAIALDPARGGADETAIATRHRDWLNVWNYAGASTPDGQTALSKVMEHRRDNAQILIDTIGIGASCFDLAKQNYPVSPVIASAKSYKRTRSGLYGFANLRAQLWWDLRELLDPDYGATLALPNHPQLLSDLTAPRFHLGIHGIQIESKEEIRKRLGRSTNVGDAIAMVCFIPQSYSPSF